ncbi:hypothetical protein D9C11_23505 (plasmid) [Bacillus subtilis subsp. subtilis]|nr:hypothetical protein D9C11_23505 [Bacillus subtilis subsp. subtilis]
MVGKYFTTIGLHDGEFEMQILVSSSVTKKKAEKVGNSGSFHIGYLYDDKLIMKGETLTISKEETDKYQFRVCRDESKLMLRPEDYECLTWEEAIKYLIEERKVTLPFTLESYYYGVHETQPFIKIVL